RADGERTGRRRRRRRGRGGEREARFEPPRTEDPVEGADREELTGEAEDDEAQPHHADGEQRLDENGEPRRRRRRGRRGGRRNRRTGEEAEAVERTEANGDAATASVGEDIAETAEMAADTSVPVSIAE